MKYLALSIPQYGEITAPSGVPSGGFFKLEEFLKLGITLAIILAIVLTLFFLIFGGIQWITSGGDKQKLQSARGRLTYAIIGLLVVLLALFIIRVVGGLFTVDLIEKYTPPGCIGRPCPPGS